MPPPRTERTAGGGWESRKFPSPPQPYGKTGKRKQAGWKAERCRGIRQVRKAVPFLCFRHSWRRAGTGIESTGKPAYPARLQEPALAEAGTDKAPTKSCCKPAAQSREVRKAGKAREHPRPRRLRKDSTARKSKMASAGRKNRLLCMPHRFHSPKPPHPTRMCGSRPGTRTASKYRAGSLPGRSFPAPLAYRHPAVPVSAEKAPSAAGYPRRPADRRRGFPQAGFAAGPADPDKRLSPVVDPPGRKRRPP